MKRLFLPMLLLCLAASSCEKIAITEDTEDATAEKQMKTVTFVMKGLEVDYGSRATMASEGLTDLWIWEGQTLIAHKVSSDTDFESPSVTLTIGAHDLTFVASKADGQTWSEGQWKCTRVKDTYGTVLAYTVSKSSTSKQVAMTRRNGKVMWTVEDAMPSGVSSLVVKVDKQCLGLDASLAGVGPQEYSSSLNITSYVGQTGVAVSLSVIPQSGDGTAMKATAKVSSTEAVVCEYNNDITVKANEACHIHGAFFAGGTAMAMSVNSTWGSTTNYSI